MNHVARQVARRFLVAELLSKQWLMGVRRGWTSLLKPTINGWPDVFKAFDKLIAFVDNLEQQVTYVYRAPALSMPFAFQEENTKIKEAFKSLRDTLKEQRGSAEHWYNVDRDPETYGRGTFTKDQGEKTLELYKQNFEGMLETHVKTRPSPKQNKYLTTRLAPLTEVMDKILELLRDQAKYLQKAIDTEGPATEDGTKTEYSEPTFTEFDIYGVKVVINDQTVTPSQIRKYVGYIKEAYAALKAKHLTEVWYGTFFIQCDACGGVNYNTGGGVGGNYPIGPDVVNIFVRPSSFIVELLAHELGHRYWFKKMSQGQRGKFESLIRAYRKPKPTGTGYLGHPIPMDKRNAAESKVYDASGIIQDAVYKFQDAKGKKYGLVFGDHYGPLANLGHPFFNHMLDAMHSMGADSQINPKVKGLFQEAMDAAHAVQKKLFDLEPDLPNAMLKVPEPAKAPKSLDVYWWGIFDQERSAWVKECLADVTKAEKAAVTYIDAAFEAYNEVENTKLQRAEKAWKDDAENDTRPVEPVSDYGKSNIDEAFAEAFMHYVTEGSMNRDQIDSFKSVLKTASLSERVLSRYLQADTIADPADYLARYRRVLAEYATVESLAKGFQGAYADLKKLTEQSPYTAELMAEMKALRATRLPSGGPESPARVGLYWQTKGFTALMDIARVLCLTIIQGFVLPPKVRKAIEAASKFWSRNPRLKGSGKTIEEWDASKVDSYLEDLEDFRKYEKLFALALEQGKGHSEEGPEATRLKAGPFIIVNTGGFDITLMQQKAALVEEAAKRMESIGLGQVCYGDVLLSNKLASRDNVVAFYHIASDEMFVMGKSQDGSDAVRTICHELTHRYEHKFMGIRRDLVKKLYATIAGHSMITGGKAPAKGDELPYKGKTLVVVDYNYMRKSVKLKDPNGNPKETYSMPLETYLELKGERLESDSSFITHYAKIGGPSENFAEMVSFYAMGKLPHSQVELLKPLI